jgi:hypothetical protein
VNTLTFIAELIKALAWPAVITVLAFLLKKPIRELIPLLTHLKYKDLELEFKQNMVEVKAEMQEELPPAPAARATGGGALVELARRSPPAAIVKAWEQVEIAAVLAAHRNGLFSPAEVTNTTRVIRALEQGRVIDSGKADLLHDLRGLRNQAAHSPDFALSTSDALDYIQVTRRIIEYLAAAGRPDANV